MGLGIAFAIIAALGVLAYIRLAPSDAAQWHVIPADIPISTRPNHWLVSPTGYDRPVMILAPPDAVAAKLAAIAMATPRTELLAGQGVHTTWITRSAIMGYPDYTTILIAPTATGSEVSIYARSRFGRSDFGVNRARVESWIKQLQ
jgi:uncharacterized protein (DUF1499 family)